MAPLLMNLSLNSSIACASLSDSAALPPVEGEGEGEGEGSAGECGGGRRGGGLDAGLSPRTVGLSDRPTLLLLLLLLLLG